MSYFSTTDFQILIQFEAMEIKCKYRLMKQKLKFPHARLQDPFFVPFFRRAVDYCHDSYCFCTSLFWYFASNWPSM